VIPAGVHQDAGEGPNHHLAMGKVVYNEEKCMAGLEKESGIPGLNLFRDHAIPDPGEGDGKGDKKERRNRMTAPKKGPEYIPGFHPWTRVFTALLLLILSVNLDIPLASGQTGPTLEGCPVFPADNIWNESVENLPVAANSAAFISTIGATQGLHPDFGSGSYAGGPIGIPYTIVNGNQEKVNITFTYADESDPGPYPLPPDAAIEGGSLSTGDRHVLVLDRDSCLLYETFDSWPQPDGSWNAGSGAIFNLRSHALRPPGWTSADASGLPILPGLVRYEEVASGEIRHALRFTAPQTRKEYLWPARHYASSLTGIQYPPMGQRFRLKASFDISGFSAEVQVILRALKKYGMILADNGSAWFICGAPDSRWDNDTLVNEFRQIKGSDFEAVDESSLMIASDSGQARQSTTDDAVPPTVSMTAPANGATVSGSGVQVTADASDNVGVAGVQFKLDAANLGSEVTVPPYTISWNTRSAANGSHTLTAVARDAAGNTTTSEGVAVTVSNSGGSSGGGGGGCFIATAAYGSPLSAQVLILREFRDTYLVSNGVGRFLVQWYYRISPAAAEKIERSASLKTLVRGILWPVVFLVWLILHPWAGGGFLLGIGLILRIVGFRRKRRGGQS
jgi:hypothetical protein